MRRNSVGLKADPRGARWVGLDPLWVGLQARRDVCRCDGTAPIVTRIEGYKHFYKAEDYHQDFMEQNPRHPYILAWDAPKVAGLKKLYPALYKPGFTPN